jgi:tRNA(fMet)-specific endonuclease VapC
MTSGRAVVDTDVVSYLFKGDTRSGPYQIALANRATSISFMSLAELDFWALRSRWGQARKAQLGAYLTRFSVVPPTRNLCRRWAEVTFACRRAGRPIESADAWIAATALELGVPLITHNRSDYAGVPNLSIISAGP